ncbi:hypothetical protein KHA80_12610 [Anaerobacillus sp. HL2]|nr:hypothetical protein KHA80_12610 [Anaerobacillus sp. HL2]
MDFRIIWMFDEIEADYNVVIKQLEKGNPSQILSNCYLNQSVFTDISEFLSEDLIKYLIPSLYTYAYQVKKVELYSKNINESLLRDFLKELVIACSSRFTHSYLTYNYKFPIIEALKKSWDELLEYYEFSLEKIKRGLC